MKTSIKALLSNIQFNLLMLMAMIFVTAFVMYASIATFERIDNLDTQKKMVTSLQNLELTDLALNEIEINGTVRQLNIMIDQLGEEHFYEFVNIFFADDDEIRNELTANLRLAFSRFDEAAKAYVKTFDEKKQLKGALLQNGEVYKTALSEYLVLQTQALYQYFLASAFVLGILFFWTAYIFIAAKRAGMLIFADVHALQHSGDPSTMGHKFHTTEMNSVAFRLRQGHDAENQPGKQDQLTQLLSRDALFNTFEQRTDKLKSGNVYVCLFEIDNFAKLINHYPVSVIEPMLIKIASILKLHKQQNDLLGRIGESRFLMVLYRNERAKAYEECENIRQMVEENRFKMPHDSIPVTFSGVFYQKRSSNTLDDTLKKAHKDLQEAQKQGGNILVDQKTNKTIL